MVSGKIIQATEYLINSHMWLISDNIPWSTGFPAILDFDYFFTVFRNRSSSATDPASAQHNMTDARVAELLHQLEEYADPPVHSLSSRLLITALFDLL